MNNEETNNSSESQSSDDTQNQQTTSADSPTIESTPKPLETRLPENAHDFRGTKMEKPFNNDSTKTKDCD